MANERAKKYALLHRDGTCRPVMLHPVKSSNIQSVGYSDQDMSLFVRFHSESIYRLDGVPASRFQELLNAESPGRYYNRELKSQFDGDRVHDTGQPAAARAALKSKRKPLDFSCLSVVNTSS